MRKPRRKRVWPSVLLVTLASVPLLAVLAAVAIERLRADESSVSEADIIPAFAPSLPPSPTEKPNPPTPMPTPEAEPTPTPPAVVDVFNEDTALSEALDAIAKRYNCAAVSLAAFDGENTYYTYQYGFADKNDSRLVGEGTKFRVASLSKIVTTICALRLVDDGMLDLDGDISGYFGHEVRNPNHPNVPITIRMLMQHTSSLYDSDTFSSSRSALTATHTSTYDILSMGTSFSRRAPGNGHQYSNFGISVLGSVCEAVSGKLLDTFARDVLFTPLGIDAAYTPASLQDTGNIAAIYNANHTISRSVQSQLDSVSSGELGRDHHLAQGSLTISAIDYAKILAMLVCGGELGDVRILSEKSVREMHNADVNVGEYKQGLAVRFQQSAFLGEDIYWHTGSAYGELTQFVYNLETGKIAVVLTTGASSGRAKNGMINVCTELAETVWRKG